MGYWLDNTGSPSRNRTPAVTSVPRKRVARRSRVKVLGHRYYNPGLGRWASRDPIGVRGGKNPYSFAKHAPMSRVDPFGLIDLPSWPEDPDDIPIVITPIISPNYLRLKAMEGAPCCEKECTITLKCEHVSIRYSRTPVEKFDATGRGILDTKTGDCDYSLADRSWYSCCRGPGPAPTTGPLPHPGLTFQCPCNVAMRGPFGGGLSGRVCAVRVEYFYLSCDAGSRKLKLKEAPLRCYYQFDYSVDGGPAAGFGPPWTPVYP